MFSRCKHSSKKYNWIKYGGFQLKQQNSKSFELWGHLNRSMMANFFLRYPNHDAIKPQKALSQSHRDGPKNVISPQWNQLKTAFQVCLAWHFGLKWLLWHVSFAWMFFARGHFSLDTPVPAKQTCALLETNGQIRIHPSRPLAPSR